MLEDVVQTEKSCACFEAGTIKQYPYPESSSSLAARLGSAKKGID